MPDLDGHGPARAYVQTDWGRDGVAVWLSLKRWWDGAARLSIVQPVELVLSDVDQPEAVDINQGPTLRLTDDMARALLDALVQHYGGHSNVQTLRRDYDAERARVDKMTAALISIATRAAPDG